MTAGLEDNETVGQLYSRTAGQPDGEIAAHLDSGTAGQQNCGIAEQRTIGQRDNATVLS